ncbi:MAG: hypothetical protein ACTHN0_04345 [Aquihabitans sp.]
MTAGDDIAAAGPRPRSVLRTVAAAVALLGTVALAASACSSDDGGSAAPEGDAAIVVRWARDDLGFGGAADCLGPYLVAVDLDGATRADLRRHQLAAVPLGARQRIGDALVVCGISDPDR